MHIIGEKTERADGPWSKQKTPCKKIRENNFIKYFFCCCCRTCSGRALTWEKLDLKKKDRYRKKQKKRQKELLYTTQMAHLYGGSRISRISNSSNSSNSNSSNNNSNFWGSGLAGPPVTIHKYNTSIKLGHWRHRGFKSTWTKKLLEQHAPPPRLLPPPHVPRPPLHVPLLPLRQRGEVPQRPHRTGHIRERGGRLHVRTTYRLKAVVPNCADATHATVVLYRVQLYRVRVGHESEGVEYGPSTSLRSSLDIHSQKH